MNIPDSPASDLADPAGLFERADDTTISVLECITVT